MLFCKNYKVLILVIALLKFTQIPLGVVIPFSRQKHNTISSQKVFVSCIVACVELHSCPNAGCVSGVVGPGTWTIIASAIEPQKSVTTFHRKTPISPLISAFKRFSYRSLAGAATMRRYLGVFRSDLVENLSSRAPELQSLLRYSSIKSLYSAIPSIDSKTSMISFERPGYFDGAYSTLSSFAYDAKWRANLVI